MSLKSKLRLDASIRMAIVGTAVVALSGCRVRQASVPSSIDAGRGMSMFYGNYDSKTNQSLTTTAQDIPNSSFRKGTQIVVSPVFQNRSEEAGLETFVLVTAAVPADESFDCHSCAPVIGMAVFTQSNNNWNISASNIAVTRAGAWGKPPSIRSIQIGPHRSAVELRDQDMGQGQTTSVLSLLVSSPDSVQLALERIIADDDAGICGEDSLPCYSNHRTLTFVPGSNSEYYDLELRLEGTDLSDGPPYKSIPVSGLERLSLQAGKYVQLSRQGALTGLDNTVSDRESLK